MIIKSLKQTFLGKTCYSLFKSFSTRQLQKWRDDSPMSHQQFKPPTLFLQSFIQRQRRKTEKIYWLSIIQFLSWDFALKRDPRTASGLARSQILNFFSVLVLDSFFFWFGTRTRTEPLGLGPTGFVPWIPGFESFEFCCDFSILQIQ